MGNRRFWVTVHLLDFKTAKSGHFFSNDGEWYFRVNGIRYPTEGYFRLSKNEALDFGELKPLVYSAMVTEDLERFMVVVEVREKQLLVDEVSVHETFVLNYENAETVTEAVASKDHKVTLNVRIAMTERPDW